MNSRYTLCLALLFSAIPSASFSLNDLAYFETRASLDRVEFNVGDVEAGLLYLFAERLPADIKGLPLRAAVEREVILNRVNAHIAHDSLAFDYDLANGDQISLITNDETLHVAYVVAQDLLADKAYNTVASDAAKTFLSEKVVTVALWLLAQTHAENLLPESITQGTVYKFFRAELARLGVAKLAKEVCK